MLAAAGIADQLVEVRSEACVFDNGVEIRAEEPPGCISYRSLDAMAKTTFEEGDRPLHRARFKERPQIAIPLPPGEQEMRFTPPAGITVGKPRRWWRDRAKMRFSAPARYNGNPAGRST
jgi:hypothetical protein